MVGRNGTHRYSLTVRSRRFAGGYHRARQPSIRKFLRTLLAKGIFAHHLRRMRVLYGERRSAVDSISSELGPLVEVLGGVTTPSGVLQSEVVVYSLAQFLLEAKIALSCLNRCVPRQILNLLKFSARQMA